MSGPKDGPGVVVVQWSPDSLGLVDQLARTMAGAGVARITCVGEGIEARADARRGGVELRTLALEPGLGFDELVARLEHDVRVVEARAVIVLPRADASEPDSISRLACAAIRKACGDQTGPNVLVEIEDPEAAFEFVGLGVATVFYSGHLRAALLGQACVDLGVFQFIIGLLRGRHRVRTIDVPAELREATFAEAALELELDERGRPMTVIGVATANKELGEGGGVIANPGPTTPLRDVLGLLVLLSGDDPDPDLDPDLAGQEPSA
ncbi:hypothetical protein ENSA5_16710 [Enhygromyxa salina]|uniref:Uncharacterized protein n=1 Tax=Enhygromyxa salina TaxID=215803 RepID=A0A2S9YE36_9BACT|nr:hypothetical protein [Enhygromyxa salina]PRQ03363.1 hypothetical protein ENSA5_16710 [Enhygromyxa salina]